MDSPELSNPDSAAGPERSRRVEGGEEKRLYWVQSRSRKWLLGVPFATCKGASEGRAATLVDHDISSITDGIGASAGTDEG